MKVVSILMVFLLVIAVSCSKKEVAVKSMEGLDAPELMQRGDEAFAQGNMEDAIKAYEMIYNRYPTSREYISAVLGMARSYNNLGDFERGVVIHRVNTRQVTLVQVPDRFRGGEARAVRRGERTIGLNPGQVVG